MLHDAFGRIEQQQARRKLLRGALGYAY